MPDEDLTKWLDLSWHVFEHEVDMDFRSALAPLPARSVTDMVRWLLGEAKRDPDVFTKFAAHLGSDLANGLRRSWEEGGEAKIREACAELDKKDAQKTLDEVASALKRITSLTVKGGLATQLESIGRATISGLSQESLLHTAITYKLIGLYPAICEKACKLTDLIVSRPASKEAEAYLEEATYCYVFGLNSACAILCRALLEQILEERLPDEAKLDWQIQNKSTPLTLRPLINLAKQFRLLPPDSWAAAEGVLRIGNRASHSGPVTERDAWDCIVATRLSVQAILSAFGRVRN